MNIYRKWSMPNSNTFSIAPIRDLILGQISGGTIIDPFANNATLREHMSDVRYITNDLNTEYNTDYHLDAIDFLRIFEDSSIDVVLYDPPYSPRQVSECYKSLGKTVNMQTTQSSYWSQQKKEISRIVRHGGKVITFGWNSGGIGSKYGFTIETILMVAHGGWHNDTICTVDIKR